MSKIVESRLISGPNDDLAVQDVYSVTEDILTAQSADVATEQLTALAENKLRVPKGTLSEINPEAASFLNKAVSQLRDRTQALSDRLGFDLMGLLDGSVEGSMAATASDFKEIAAQSLGLVWEYAAITLGIRPADRQTLEAAFQAIQNFRLSTGADDDDLSNAIDTGAETLVYSALIDRMLGAGLNEPIKEIIRNLSNDQVKQQVSERSVVKAIRPYKGRDDHPAPTPTPTAKTYSLKEGPVHVPESDIAPRFESALKPPIEKRMDGDVWARKPVKEMTDSTRPNWNQPPEQSYQDFFVEVSQPLPVTQSSTSEAGGGFDFEIVDTLVSYTSPDRLLDRYPGLPGMILTSYRLPDQDYRLAEEYARLTGLLDSLYPSWVSTERAGESIGWLTHLTQASADAIYVLTAYPESQYVAEIMIAPAYQRNDIYGLLKAQYPLAAI